MQTFATNPTSALVSRGKLTHKGPAYIAGIPLYIYAVTFASLSTFLGIMWDLSWHRTVGRDALLSPPHLLIYAGAIIGGLFSAIQLLWGTFLAPAKVKNGLVKIWGVFYSSLGALFCIWGAVAMLTSAPFDDWWHNAYGLDVIILSPPHVLLGLGMLFLQFGACVSISKYLNEVFDKSGGAQRKRKNILQLLFIIAAASLLCMISILGTDQFDKRYQRTGSFYIAATMIFLLFLPAFKRELRMKYGMTAITITYFLIIAITNWVMQLVPATPKLGPILNPVTHLQALMFPLLLFIPGFAMDVISAKVKRSDWMLAGVIAIVFVVLLFAVQYPFSGFLLESPSARNWIFGSESWYYGSDPGWQYRYKFRPNDTIRLTSLLKALLIAVFFGFFTTRFSLRWGKWLQSIQR